jgi:hypothetical protein
MRKLTRGWVMALFAAGGRYGGSGKNANDHCSTSSAAWKFTVHESPTVLALGTSSRLMRGVCMPIYYPRSVTAFAILSSVG